MKIDVKKYHIDALNCGMELCKKIRSFGHEAYIVGGCVRDLVRCELGQTSWPDKMTYMSEAIHDIDIATNMPIEALKENFRTESNNGEAHGTILVFYGMGDPFEVTQFRLDGNYSDNRHPDSVEFTRSFAEDCKRRDFTMNALGMDGDGNIIDTVGGVDDIEHRLIKTVGDPDQRFKEDALRIVRGVRFSVNFDYVISMETKIAMRDNAELLRKVSVERFRKEIDSLYKKNLGFQIFLNYLQRLGLKDHIPTFDSIEWHKLYVIALRSPRLSDQVYAVMLYAASDFEKAAKDIVATRDDKRLAKFYIAWDKKMDLENAGQLVSWADMVDFVDGDYDQFITMQDQREVPARWRTMIPIAIRLLRSYQVDQKKISEQVEKMGITPGPQFGAEVRKRVEAYYNTVASFFI